MSRAAVIRTDAEAPREITLDNGHKYLTRKPSFRQLAEAIQMLKPSDYAKAKVAQANVRTVPDVQGAPPEIEAEDTERQLALRLKMLDLMRITSVDPMIVDDGAELADNQIWESDALSDVDDYCAEIIKAWYGKREAADAPFRGGIRSGAGPDGAAVSEDAA